MIDQFTPLERTIRRYRDRRFSIIEPGGNHGDTLIYRGLEKRLDEMGIEYESLHFYKERKNRPSLYVKRELNKLSERLGYLPFKDPPLDSPEVILIQGGGNFNEFWPRGLVIFKNVLYHYPDTPVIVAPQSYWTYNIDLAELVGPDSQQIHLFAREQYSHSLLQKYDFNGNVEIGLSPDTALHLHPEDLRQYIDEDHQRHQLNRDHSLLAFRDEKTGLMTEEMVANLAAETTPCVRADISDETEFTFNEFVTLAAEAERIYTDRLHVTVLGHVLGKPVEMYDVVWFKNKAVYRYSLKSADNIKFNYIGPDS